MVEEGDLDDKLDDKAAIKVVDDVLASTLATNTWTAPCPMNRCQGFGDKYGDHAISCAINGERIAKHNHVRDAIFAAASQAALGPRISLAAITALPMSCFPSGPMAKMLRLMSPLSILCSNNLLDKSQGKEKKESDTPLTSKWGNTVKDARQRELCSFPWLLTLLVDGTRTR